MKNKSLAQEQGVITLVPLGLDEESHLEVLGGDLERVFDFQVRIVNRKEIPANSYNPQRNQYQAPLFLKALRRCMDPEKKEKVLGVTDKDLYVEGLNFVFGQAELQGSFAMISFTRLHQSFYALPEDRVLFLKRIKKEAVHELGHTFGLRHCPNSDCVMCFSNSLHDTDRKSAEFCQSCKTRLEQLLRP
ncbi:MAG: archaemetzincin family Zn-dependent metalloprotease [Candidatus Aminicenantes bacterium]|nr:archaemetzincin family Zn-dependent metalloprotease [Candidatus Aminicenantes bacterium]MDH5385621.1 archaemetzincin family Zn-dependent metalloprotease [Candidatus Aminicenantes bacterium]MDH5743667.1 archaemetzincin family Zn-dependent metalloprotease [Candidatus Aminicenantes bacterium]